jgi:hypothetical protein
VLEIDASTHVVSRVPVTCGPLALGNDAWLEAGRDGQPPVVSAGAVPPVVIEDVPVRGHVRVRAASCAAEALSIESGEVARDVVLRGRLALHAGDFVSRWGAHREHLHVNFKAQQRVGGVLAREAVFALDDLHLERLHPDEPATTPWGVTLGARTDLYDDSFDLYFHPGGAIALGRPMRPQTLGALVLGDPRQSHTIAFWPNGRVLCAAMANLPGLPPLIVDDHAPFVLFSPAGQPVLVMPVGFERPRLVTSPGGHFRLTPVADGHPAFARLDQCDDFVVSPGRPGAEAELERLRAFLRGIADSGP